MADITITPQACSIAGITPSDVAVSDAGDDFYMSNNGKTLLHVKNDSGSSINVTITGANECDQGFTHDATIAVADGAEAIIAPFVMSRFNNSDGNILINFSASTSVTYAAYKLA